MNPDKTHRWRVAASVLMFAAAVPVPVDRVAKAAAA
jgi:hypothetical protein